MKNITKESIEQDLKIIQDMVFKYKSPYLSDYRRRTDLENQLKHKEL